MGSMTGSLVDYQAGLVQKILCDKYEKSHLNACHLLEGTICHILQHCGDSRGRFYQCEYSFDLSSIYPTMLSFMLSHGFIFVPGFLLLLVVILLAVIPEML